MADIQALYDERAKLVEEQRKMWDAYNGKPLSAEDKQKEERQDARYKELTEAIQREEKIAQRESAERELADYARDSAPAFEKAAETNSKDATDKRRKAFNNFLRTGQVPRELRDFSGSSQNIGDNGDGGYLVPDEFEQTLYKLAMDQNVMRQLATVRTTSTGTLTVPYRNTIPTAAQKDEKATYATGNIEFLTLTIDCHKITQSIPVTEEAQNDIAFDIEAEIQEAGAEGIAALEESWFVTGNGTKQAYGVVTGATAGVTAASTSAITGDELLGMFHAVKPKYRRGPKCGWLMEDATALVLRKIKNGNQDYIWQQGLQQGSPDRLLDRPVYYAEAMASIATSAVPILFGDFSYYRIADRVGMRVIRDPYSASKEGLVWFTFSKRTGGRLILSEAVAKLTMAAG